MFRTISNFCKREDGAVTIDWVVLTAFVAFMASVVAIFIAGPVRDIDTKNGAAMLTVVDQVETMEITVSFDE
ncbi:hypothetical protein [Ruegeria atlantica]|uniref:Flp pilus assembly protein, pilin Flp n=1 Tax=Ruegeria atlantica TaxID=81569 RepID=A0A0P1E201_9RHOB|nr:hypothetical protein [Ruegeria atlantica]CUH42181.1 hypothetical protein RUM4293_01067 [Ruegeria atlantica]